ncbi:hypothetical protein [Thiohalophilus sp.]|uniref:hypothetical protein n=1 Tax=Thiohalophilus sp. TaxID=3028392 RepID=UPI002ACE3C5B|nr:hypothetical protein [Thiohalophilus sp.]MDZ7661401.1 hypothetical protein [Thiohalophilus sp.]
MVRLEAGQTEISQELCKEFGSVQFLAFSVLPYLAYCAGLHQVIVFKHSYLVHPRHPPLPRTALSHPSTNAAADLLPELACSRYTAVYIGINASSSHNFLISFDFIVENSRHTGWPEHGQGTAAGYP